MGRIVLERSGIEGEKVNDLPSYVEKDLLPSFDHFFHKMISVVQKIEEEGRDEDLSEEVREYATSILVSYYETLSCIREYLNEDEEKQPLHFDKYDSYSYAIYLQEKKGD